jgi:Flp pilus assembly protein TadD
MLVLLQEAVRLRSSYADAYTGMGVSLKELKRKEEAEQCFAQVVRLRPNCALSLGNLAGDCLPTHDLPLPTQLCKYTVNECVQSSIHQ